MAANTRIQVRRGYSAGYSSENLIGSTPLTSIWTNGIQLSEGEIGYEIDTGRFKIGKYINGTLATWQNLPYAGGSDIIPGTGIATIFDVATNKHTIHSRIDSSGVGISLSQFQISGDGLTSPSGGGYSIGLSDRLQTLSNLTSSGIIVGTNASGVTTRSLSDGDNISITNRDGISNNPIISLKSSLTGLSSISGGDNFTIGSTSGISIDAGNGVVSIDDLTVSGETNLNGNINIGLAARILATGPIAFSGNPVTFVGQTIFDTLPKVGPTGNNGANATGISLVGHQHVYADITDFCSGVADCVDTQLSPSTGIQFNYVNDVLNVSLSGQSLRLHNLNTNGLIVRNSDSSIESRTIIASGTNIVVATGNGVGGNPAIGLNSDISINSLSTDSTVTVGTNLTVQGNLIVNGSTVTTNVETIEIEDPTVRVGATSGTLSSIDYKDRGIEFVYQVVDGVPITGFFGYDHSSRAFSFIDSATNSNGIYSGTSGLLNVGGLYSSGGISGTVLTSTVAEGSSAPIAVNSSGLVTNLNSDYLDGQHGSHYLNAGNLTGTLPSGRLPTITFTSGTNSPTSSFINSVNVDSAGRLLSVTTGTFNSATTSTLGIASFSSGDFSVSNGAVTIKAGGVDNNQLANSSWSIGSGSYSLGDTASSLSGLTMISGINNNTLATTLYNCVIDGGTP